MTTQPEPSTRRRYLGGVGHLVDRRVSTLQDAYLRGNLPWARATLANLRKAITRDPGTVPEIWDWTSYPTDAGAPDEPTREEKAVHLALCLYSIHQQGKSMPVHVPGLGLGRSVHDLAGDNSELDSPVRRRFSQVITASSIEECAHHLRGLVTQFRGAQPLISLDYGQLADDLLQLQIPGGFDHVRLRWSRQYYNTIQTSPRINNSAESTNKQLENTL